MLRGLDELKGKTIAKVVVASGAKAPKMQVFLMFTDGTFYEFYSDWDIRSSSSVGIGGLQDIREKAARNDLIQGG